MRVSNFLVHGRLRFCAAPNSKMREHWARGPVGYRPTRLLVENLRAARRSNVIWPWQQIPGWVLRSYHDLMIMSTSRVSAGPPSAAYNWAWLHTHFTFYYIRRAVICIALWHPAPGLQNKTDWRVCRHFAARVTITFYTASARFQLAARSVALC